MLHVVDKDTKFNSAIFLCGETADEVWRTYEHI